MYAHICIYNIIVTCSTKSIGMCIIVVVVIVVEVVTVVVQMCLSREWLSFIYTWDFEST